MSSISEQTVLNDRYRLGEELGRGGMGVVYRAHDSVLDREVAVKLLSNLGLGTEGRARLLHEAQAVAKLSHPNIVPVFDAGEAEEGPFIVMEMIEGESLHDRPPADLEDIIEVSCQICDALDHAHSHKVIHRDLKPENVLITPEGTAKLMDFGLARPVSSRLTKEGTLTGTVFYMAPEQALGKVLDGRVDLYALGVVLYELTTGRLPFEADDPLGVISQHINAQAIPPSKVNASLPAQIESIILKLLAKEPDDRYRSAREVQAALTQALDQLRQPPAQVDLASEGKGAAPTGVALLDRMVRGRLVGRQRDFAELRGFWNRAEQGEGHLVLLSGEPGIGKTRLARELVVYARLRGAIALEGQFYPELGMTYSGIREALLTFIRSLPPEEARELIGPSAPELVKLLPEVSGIVGDVTPNPPMGELDAERLRLFDHVTQFLLRIAEKGPILLLLEDLHWADGPSLLFLHFLLRNTRQDRILALGTYRETELDPAKPFYESLLDLNRERLYTRIALRRLKTKDVSKLVGVLVDGPVNESLVAAIAHDTDGNPFFIEEVVKGLVEGDALRFEKGVWQPLEEAQHDIPQSIQVAIGKRLEGLTEDARAALGLAAIQGREFNLDVLLQMLNWEEDRLLDALDLGVKAQLLTAVEGTGDDQYRFAHALLVQVLYEGINPRRRARYHQRAAEALEEVFAKRVDDFVEPLAHHYSLAPAKVAEKAVAYNLRAAENAVAVYAHEQAIRHYALSLEALEDLDDPERETQIWELMGDTQMKLYYAQEAAESYERALQALESVGTVEAEAHCRLSYKLGELMIREQRDPGRARAYLERALASRAEPSDSLQRVKCMAALAVCMVEEGFLDEAYEQAKEALELADRLGLADGIASACGALCDVHRAQGDLKSYAAVSERQIEALDETQDLYGIFETYHHVIMAAADGGDYERAGKFALAGLEVCQRFNAPGWEATILAGYIYALTQQGRWTEAFQYGDRVLPLFDRVGCQTCFMYIFLFLAEIEARRGQTEQSRNHIQTAMNIIIQLGLVPLNSIRWRFFGHVYLEEWEQAWAVVEEAQAGGHSDIGIVGSQMYWSWHLPEVAARVGRWSEAEHIANDTMALFEEAGVPFGTASSHFALGLANAGQGIMDEAISEFELALAAHQTFGHTWDLANAQYELGKVCAAHGDPDRAKELLQEALTSFQALQARPGEEKVELALRSLA